MYQIFNPISCDLDNCYFQNILKSYIAITLLLSLKNLSLWYCPLLHKNYILKFKVYGMFYKGPNVA